MTLAPGMPPSQTSRRGGLAHQRIVDRDGVLRGNELLFRSGAPRAEGEDFDGERATATVLVTAACDIGWDSLGGGSDLYINVDHLEMLDRVLAAAPTERTVVELVESLDVDDELVARLELLRTQGLRVALDDFVPGSPAERLLPVVDVVKVDVLVTPPSPQVGELVQRLHDLGVLALAEKVEDEQMHQQCLDLGFDLFQGYWYGRPSAQQPMALSPTRLLCLRLLGLLTADEPDIDQIERLICSDPALVLRTLRMANSAAVGAARRISSVRQAVVLVGAPVLTGWTALMLLAAETEASADLTEILVRARVCETVARRDLPAAAGEAFLCGLIGGMTRQGLADPDQLLTQIGASDQIRVALVEGTGALGTLVRSVDEHLDGGDSGVHVELAHLAALAWTTELTRLQGA